VGRLEHDLFLCPHGELLWVWYFWLGLGSSLSLFLLFSLPLLGALFNEVCQAFITVYTFTIKCLSYGLSNLMVPPTSNLLDETMARPTGHGPSINLKFEHRTDHNWNLVRVIVSFGVLGGGGGGGPPPASCLSSNWVSLVSSLVLQSEVTCHCKNLSPKCIQ
jgi:hypothetical protein